MKRNLIKISKLFSIVAILFFSIGMTVNAEEDLESVDTECSSFTENDELWNENFEGDQYVDGIYNVSGNARASMTGVIRLCQSDGKLVANYSTSYTYSVDKIGVKNIKLQYKGSLGIWHDIITLDNRYRTNAAAYQGAFSCSGVIGRVYRLKGTHYIVDGSYTETRNNVTDTLTF